MKKWSKQLLSALCVAALLVGLLPLAAVAAEPEHTVWLVGDSTVCAFTDSYYYPRYGYGTQIENYLDGTYKVENVALSGRSSKSFLTEANYTKLKEGIKAGDALIIGFGHNDEKAGATFTDPKGDWQTEGSFAKSLYDNYVKLAQDKGAEAILCTPIVRRTTGDTFSSSQLHVTDDGDYPAAIRKLGTDKSVAVVDLTELTKALYTQLTPAETLYLHAWTASKEASVDNTHLNIYGAKVVARMLASALKDGNTELGKHVVLGAEPSKATDLVSNPDYKEPTYTGELPQSELWEDYNVYTVNGDVAVTFKGTVFGDMGGGDNISKDFETLETDEQGNMRIAVTNNKGKIASGADGIAMYYYKIPAGKTFTISATATINSFGAGNSALVSQAAFGLMARDDMYIDTYDATIKSDYVAAATWANSSGGCASYYRKDGKLAGRGTLADEDALAIGKSYQLVLTYNGDGHACTFGNSGAQTGGFDFQLTSVDPDNVFVGMYAVRNADVTFSDIYLEVDGQVLCGTAPVLPQPPEPPDPNATDAVAGGGLETLFAELPDVADADVTAVSYSGAMEGELTGDDLTYLVRDVALSGGKTGVRIDIPGVKAGEYELSVTAAGKVYTAKGLTVQAHDRSGFAHQTATADSACTAYTEGVGAYNDDGTLKDNAIVLYVTDANKDTVTASFTRNGDPKTVTGIGNILNSNNSKVNQGLLEFLSKENKRPLVVRFIGNVTAPQGVSEYKKGSSNGGMVYMLSGANVTLEGIGPDATINGWGFSFGADKDDSQYNKQARNFEVRNLSFKNVPEDCVEVTGFGNSDGSIKEPVEHAWVHNCEFFVPHISNPAEDDKGEGDGAVDFKWGQYMTMSYNVFNGYHKTSLIGGHDSNEQYHVTWHHNHWLGCDQRGPLGRTADMHIYNNIYENQKSYCMSLRAKVYIFSENNAFPGSKDPVKDEGTGGVCKSFGDDFAGTTGVNAAIKAATKDEKVISTNKFANFDTAAGSYVAKGAYKLDTLAQAKTNIETWGGTMKAAADMTTVAMTAADVPAEPADKEALSAAIAAAEKAIDVYTVSDDTKTSDVNSGTKFVKQSDKAAYQAAIDAAKAVADKAAATQAEVDQAVADLAAATTAFNKAIQTGTKSTGGGGGGGGGSSRPSGGSSGGSSSGGSTANNTVKKTTNGKGDTVITVTAPNGEELAKVTLPATAPTADNKFVDVPDDHWAAQAINTMAALGMVKGVSDDTYDMASPMTRGAIATVLYRLSNGAAGKTTTFADVGENLWYTDAIGWAASTGVVNGYSATAFGPDDTITRQQLAVMLARYAKLLGLDTSADTGVLGDFADASAVGAWATDGMAWCVKVGIVKGRSSDILDPAANVTRAEAALMMYRMLDLIK